MMKFTLFLICLLNILNLITCQSNNNDDNNYGILNPLVKQADPQPISIIENGTRIYYFPASNYGGGEVYMYSSSNLSDVYLGTKDPSLNSTETPNTIHTIFQFTSGVHQSPEAPAMFKWNDTAGYIMYVSSDGPEGNRIYALQNDGKNLNSSWSFAGVVQYSDGTPITGYDAFAFNHPNGNKYLLYTNITTIFINQFDPEYGYSTLNYPSTPTEEGLNGTVVASRYYEKYVEAPDVMISGEMVNVLWTENDYFSPNYTTYGRAVSTELDPLDPTTWQTGEKVEIVASNNQTQVYGTGSVGTFIGPNDQPWIAYTCFYQDQAFNRSGPNDPRHIQTQPLILKDDIIQPFIPIKPNRQGFNSTN